MGKSRELSRTRINPLGHNNKKRSSYNESGDSASSSSSDSNSGGSSSSSNSSSHSGSNHNNKTPRGTLSRLGSYISSKTSSSSPLGIKTSGRVKKRSYDSKGNHTPQLHISMEKNSSYAREFSGIIPDNELELEKIFEGNPNVWGFLESMNTTVVQSKLLKRSPVGSTNTVRGPTSDRYSYLIGSGPTCDIRVYGDVLEQHHCMIYHRLEVLGVHQENSILLNDRSKKGVWINNERMGKSEIQLKNGDIISFKESDACEPYLSLKIRLPSYFRLLRDDNNFGINAFYRIQKLIGSGSFGEVYAAKCKATGKTVALKTIPQSKYAGKPKTLQSLLREIAVYTSLQHHPCIVRMERVLEVDGVFYIAMELGQHGDLFDHVCGIVDPLAEDEVRIIFDQIFHAVEYIHDQDIAHRDLKLENIILMDRNKLHVKIADFGLATFYRGKPFHTMCGTQSYAAPELVLESKCSYDKAVDIWSLGVMLFIALVKTPPFYDPSSQLTTPEQNKIMINRIKSGDYNFESVERWEKISEEAKDLIRRMLVVDTKERYNIKQVLQHPWLQQVESERTLVKGYKRCPELVEYLKNCPNVRPLASVSPPTVSPELPSSPRPI